MVWSPGIDSILTLHWKRFSVKTWNLIGCWFWYHKMINTRKCFSSFLNLSLNCITVLLQKVLVLYHTQENGECTKIKVKLNFFHQFDLLKGKIKNHQKLKNIHALNWMHKQNHTRHPFWKLVPSLIISMPFVAIRQIYFYYSFSDLYLALTLK